MLLSHTLKFLNIYLQCFKYLIPFKCTYEDDSSIYVLAFE